MSIPTKHPAVGLTLLDEAAIVLIVIEIESTEFFIRVDNHIIRVLRHVTIRQPCSELPLTELSDRHDPPSKPHKCRVKADHEQEIGLVGFLSDEG